MTTVLGTPPPPTLPGTRTADVVTGRRRRGRGLAHLGFIAPAVLLVAAVIYYSVGYTFWLSLTDSDGINPGAFVGLDNFARAVSDPTTWAALAHSALFLLVIPTQMLLGLVIAALLHSSVRLKGLYKVVVFIPTITATAVMAPVFRQVFAADGSVNDALETVGLGGLTQAWLGDPSWALPTLMVINVWQWTGLSFILYYAGLTQIEASTFEAARLDGASNLRILTSIIVPMMKGTHVTLLILGVMGVLKTFDLVFLVTGGGPAKSTEFLSTYIYETTITRFDAGYGAALSVLLLALSLGFTVWQMRRYRRAGGAGV
ncbi:carbohydrate ABC transporter permease [Desertihabitans aurantiacus]|uniref:carbohydrate ABC transporter permease n=1 Tax=Desertihabitans aurantiacus TaxID=2282477 RepID=UPI0018E59BE1|nr:sugar ABC transporter permease [Desertihabitans aurantiacus]